MDGVKIPDEERGGTTAPEWERGGTTAAPGEEDYQRTEQPAPEQLVKDTDVSRKENKEELKKRLEEVVKILYERIAESNNRIKELERLKKEKMELLLRV